METAQTDFIVSLTTSIHVPVEKVWNALVDPAQIKKYLYGTETKTDWKPGSPITFSGTWEGKSYQDKGIILGVKPNKLLKYTYWSSMSGKADLPENYATVSFLLKPEKNGTLLTLTQDNNKTEESMKHSEENWTKVLYSLKKLLEG